MYDHNLFAYIQLVYLDTPVLSNGYGFVHYEGKWGRKGAEKKTKKKLTFSNENYIHIEQ